MIRTLNFCLTLLALFLTTFCMAQKSELKFNKDGKFKIVQFTDVHFKYGNPASDVALERINQVLDAEQPDVVIFTGDVIYSAPADSGMLKVLEQVSKRKLPFVDPDAIVRYNPYRSGEFNARPGNCFVTGLCADSEVFFRS